MRCSSLGFATDLAILELGGSTIERRDGYWSIRSPHAPTYYWGNFLLADSLNEAVNVAQWHQRFAAEFPHARHFALGVNNPILSDAETHGFTELGSEVSAMSVLTRPAPALVEVDGEAEQCRALVSDDDWNQALSLGVATRDEDFSEDSFRTFFANYLAMQRVIVRQGNAAWWGSFEEGKLVSQCGIVSCGDGLARFQMVSTHPGHRRRGFASQTVAAAGKFAAETYRTETLVIVADPNDHAISIYRDLGFVVTEQQVSIERRAETDA